MKDLPQTTAHQSAAIPGERGRYVTERRALPEFTVVESLAYDLWREEAKAASLKRNLQRGAELRKRSGMRGKVLTENGWEIPSGPDNPRIVEHETTLPTAYETAREAAIQAQVAHAAEDHEHAVKAADMWEFQRMYRDGELPERFYMIKSA